MKRLMSLMLFLCLCSVPVWAQSPEFIESDCPFGLPNTEQEGETVICGVLIVPESRQGLSDADIELQVVIITSTSSNPASDSILYLEGGPGGSAVAAVDFWLKSSLRTYSDIILYDQRGTGYSIPALDCDEYLPEDVAEDADIEAICLQAFLDEGIVLEAYNSAESAADINDLLIALDIEANLFGVSYGTRLALTVMRDYPERIRSVIIDAVYPPHVQGYEEQALNAYRAFKQLFDDCNADSACTVAYGDLEELFYTMVDDLNQEPMIGYDEDDNETELYGDDVVNTIFEVMYDSSSLYILPAMIQGAANRDFEMYSFPDDSMGEGEESSIEDGEYVSDGDADGMFNSVECQEEVPFNTLEGAEALSVGIPPQIANSMLLSVEQTFATCELWGVPASPAIENEPVISGIPTLVLSGNYDPITPPAWGDEAQRYLSNSVHFVFAGIGHGAVDTHPCPTQIALEFLETLDPSSLDSSCVGNMTAPKFFVP